MLLVQPDIRGVVLKEAEDAKWLDVETIDSVKWLHVDITLMDEIKRMMA